MFCDNTVCYFIISPGVYEHLLQYSSIYMYMSTVLEQNLTGRGRVGGWEGVCTCVLRQHVLSPPLSLFLHLSPPSFSTSPHLSLTSLHLSLLSPSLSSPSVSLNISVFLFACLSLLQHYNNINSFSSAGVRRVGFATTSAAAQRCPSDVATTMTTFSMHSEWLP